MTAGVSQTYSRRRLLLTAAATIATSRPLERLARAAALPDCSVDFVLANRYLHHVESPALALVEAARILLEPTTSLSQFQSSRVSSTIRVLIFLTT